MQGLCHTLNIVWVNQLCEEDWQQAISVQSESIHGQIDFDSHK